MVNTAHLRNQKFQTWPSPNPIGFTRQQVVALEAGRANPTVALERFQETSDRFGVECFAAYAAFQGRAGTGWAAAIGIKLKTL